MISYGTEKDNNQSNETTVSVEYISCSDLKPFESDINLEGLIAELRKNTDINSQWTDQFEALNTIRRLNKFNSDIFKKIIYELCPVVCGLTTSIRSYITKMSIMLIKEIFNSSNLHSEDAFVIKQLIMSTVGLLSHLNNFIKKEAASALEILANNPCYHNINTVLILISEIANRNLTISEGCYLHVEELLNKWDLKEFNKIKDEQWIALFGQIDNLYNLKREPYNKRACKLVENLANKIGDEAFEQKLNKLNYDVTLFRSMIDSVRKKTKDKGTIKDFVKDSKKLK